MTAIGPVSLKECRNRWCSDGSSAFRSRGKRLLDLVELPGIEPGSPDPAIGLLRA
jgi:hypothetical protein